MPVGAKQEFLDVFFNFTIFWCAAKLFLMQSVPRAQKG